MPNNTSDTIRVRMAPSPTGTLHIGTARTTLFNYLYAKHYGGTFVLRIEDTDTERSQKEFEQNILEGLSWMGMTWDEGIMPDGSQRGDYGPYRQSERAAHYRTYLEKLLHEGYAFYCWHTADELQEEQQEQVEKKEAPRHVCAYRDFALERDDERVARSIIRFRNDAQGTLTFDDLAKGEITFDPRLLGDFSIAKNLDTALYNFAVVVDDHEMRISHVIRGEDHISNTPKQLLLFEALGIPAPHYLHLPLILGPDRSKLSKRHGETSVTDYRRLGFLPQALFNFIALLGWHPENEEEIMEAQTIIDRFSVDGLHQSGAVFDIEKLSWMNSEYIRALSLEGLTALCKPYFEEAGFITQKTDEQWLQKVVALEQTRIQKLSEIIEATAFIFAKPRYEKDLLSWKGMEPAAITEALQTVSVILEALPEDSWDAKTLQEHLMPAAEKAGDRGRLLWPLRAALTGRKTSPGPFDIIEVLGKTESIKRVQEALALLAA